MIVETLDDYYNFILTEKSDSRLQGHLARRKIDSNK
jgi:hypothetical protein